LARSYLPLADAKEGFDFSDCQSIVWDVEISDPKAIRALAHPLRLDLLQILGASGQATAAQCGRALGVSQASCSFHLRQLAKYGFVEDAGPVPDRRERQWRVAHLRLTVRPGAGGEAIRQQVESLVVERELQAILDYSRRPDGADSEWEHKAGLVTGMAVLSPDDAAELKEKWIALVRPYLAKTRAQVPAPGQRYVRYFLATTPLPAAATSRPGPESADSEDAPR
jgi:DNA-binding transcriptional ArsR family regulator